MESIELTVAILSVISAIIGLLAAIIGRKKIVEIKYNPSPIYRSPQRNNNFTKERWYNRTFWLVFWMFLFWPVGIYGVFKSQFISKNWKISIIIIYATLIFIVAAQN